MQRRILRELVGQNLLAQKLAEAARQSQRRKSSAPIGSSEDAPKSTTAQELSSINALYVASSTTERLHALEQRRHKAQTPFVPDAWELMLTQLSLFHFLPTLPNILRHRR